MSNQKKLLDSIPCNELADVTHIDVEVYYSKDRRPRGYYLSVKPVKHEGRWTSYNLFSGSTKLLMETSRFSARQFEQAVLMGRAAAPELVKQVIEKEKAA